MKKLFCLLFMAIFLSACKTPAPFPVNREWQLIELKNKSVPASVKATLRFEPGKKRYSGKNACNNFSGTYELDDTTLKFGPAMSTKMYCADVADWEAAFMNMLPTVDNYAYRDNQLKLFAGTKIVAIFK